jgi:hypothetical protein
VGGRHRFGAGEHSLNWANLVAELPLVRYEYTSLGRMKAIKFLVWLSPLVGRLEVLSSATSGDDVFGR